jgi:hypothetical protein
MITTKNERRIMNIELMQTHVPEDLGPEKCCACGLVFEQGPAVAWLFGEGQPPLHVGYVCPRCLSRGPEYIEKRMRQNAVWAWRAAEEAERIAQESVEDMPTLAEYEGFARWFGGPRFASIEEANASLGY